MRTVTLHLPKDIDFPTAEEAAKRALGRAGDVTLTAWTDRKRNMEGPREACAQESWKCARVYAENHGADVRISINDDDYEFYFTGVPADFEELDEETALEIHKELTRADFDNVQGG
jgi:hypothetical protein